MVYGVEAAGHFRWHNSTLSNAANWNTESLTTTKDGWESGAHGLKALAPWVDLETDKVLLTLPRSWLLSPLVCVDADVSAESSNFLQGSALPVKSEAATVSEITRKLCGLSHKHLGRVLGEWDDALDGVSQWRGMCVCVE